MKAIIAKNIGTLMEKKKEKIFKQYNKTEIDLKNDLVVNLFKNNYILLIVENTRSLELKDPLKEINEQHQRHELNELKLKLGEYPGRLEWNLVLPFSLMIKIR
ncbi:hypothetical protein BpHYR1_034616 [Brachionus plicatilis]|uniref:Uncharacterized protein n=1 Tax=Brachionus plicatilis TaxID=10195 RepID=A0A3M7SZQ9_BRAPC|nr:hypothetical protein BpHYR1_034616 [Brachionus plicatilis]